MPKKPGMMMKKMPGNMPFKDHAEENMMERKKMMGMMPGMPPNGLPEKPRMKPRPIGEPTARKGKKKMPR